MMLGVGVHPHMHLIKKGSRSLEVENGWRHAREHLLAITGYGWSLAMTGDSL